MQIADMRVLRTLYSHKQFFIRGKHKLFSRPSLISLKIIQTPQIFRQFHFTNHLHGHESSVEKSIGAWTMFGTAATAISNSDEQKAESSVEDEKLPGVSNLDDKDESPRRTRKVKLTHGIIQNRKKGKKKVHFVCSDCGHTEAQWWGTCRSCSTVGTLMKFTEGEDGVVMASGVEVSENAEGSWLPSGANPLRLSDVNRGTDDSDWRIPLSGLFGAEVARVLGGGLVPGSLVLVGGDPGVGKSTLLLQIAAIIAEGRNFGKPAPVVYVSGEESLEQIGNRADRMRIVTEEIFLYSSTDIEDILEKIQLLSPQALVIDSIQTVYLRGVVGSAGGLSQVKECTSALLRFAKKTRVPVLLIGHVTKTGEIAGPRVLEHIVDVVLYMEGEKCSSHRLLRSVKNRFGSTDELGVFEMSQSGLQAVSNPSEMFLTEQHSDSDFLAGLAVAVIMDGSRTFLIEIQLQDACTIPSVTSLPWKNCCAAGTPSLYKFLDEVFEHNFDRQEVQAPRGVKQSHTKRNYFHFPETKAT